MRSFIYRHTILYYLVMLQTVAIKQKNKIRLEEMLKYKC